MAAVHQVSLLNLALNEAQPAAGARFGWLFLASLALHCGFVVLLGNLRLPDSGHHAFDPQTVLLVSLSETKTASAPLAKRVVKEEPVPKKTALAIPPEPAPKAAPPVEQPQRSPAAPQPKLIPAPSISVSETAEARLRAETLMQEALSTIKLPPERLPAQTATKDTGRPRPPALKKVVPIPDAPPPRSAAEVKARSQARVQEALSQIKLPPDRVPTKRSTSPAAGTVPVLELPEVPDLVSKTPAKSVQEKGARSGGQIDEALQSIELPPETPEFENLSSLPTMAPTPTVPQPLSKRPAMKAPGSTTPQPQTKQVQKNVHSILGDLTVPELPAMPAAPQQVAKAFEQKPQKRSSLSEDVRSELRAIEKRRRTVAPAPSVQETGNAGATSSKSQLASRTAPVGEPTRARKPVVSIQATDAPSRWSKYLSLVQQKISQHWVAPPVEIADESLVVVVKFRLFRSGTVSEVSVERPSGNEYYDLAARRAIMSAEPLPSFPRSMLEPYLDAHFTFAVGEQIG